MSVTRPVPKNGVVYQDDCDRILRALKEAGVTDPELRLMPDGTLIGGRAGQGVPVKSAWDEPGA